MIKQEEVECESLESNQSMEFEYLSTLMITKPTKLMRNYLKATNSLKTSFENWES